MSKAVNAELGLKAAAVVTIRSAGTMTAKGRKAIAGWLRHHADMLEEHGKNYTEKTFTGRYLYKAAK